MLLLSDLEQPAEGLQYLVSGNIVVFTTFPGGVCSIGLHFVILTSRDKTLSIVPAL